MHENDQFRVLNRVHTKQLLRCPLISHKKYAEKGFFLCGFFAHLLGHFIFLNVVMFAHLNQPLIEEKSVFTLSWAKLFNLPADLRLAA